MSTSQQLGKSHWTAQAINRLMKDINSQPLENLMLTEGKIYGARYYCVEPVGGSWLDMEVWCTAAFGDPGSVWIDTKAPTANHQWYMNNRKFWFRDIKDRDWFVLRWR